MSEYPKTKKLIPLPELKRYDTPEEFRKQFQSFFPAFRVKEKDHSFREKMGYVGRLIHINIPRKLYKYRAVHEYSIHNFENDEFICSNPIAFNDPFDCLLYFAIDGLEKEVEKYSRDPSPILSRWFQIRQRVKEENIPWETLDEQTKYIVSLPDSVFVNFNIHDFREGMKQIHSIAKQRLFSKIDFFQRYSFVGCLTENNDCPLMWGHYADAHKGFCLEYDLSNNTFVVENTKPGVTYFKNLYPVVYSREKYCATKFAMWEAENMMGFSDGLLKDVLFWNKALTHKSDKWEYENEWRIVINPLHSEHGKLERYPLNLKPTAIYYGCKFEEQPSEYKKTIRDLAKKKGLRQYQMEIKYDNMLYAITPVPI